MKLVALIQQQLVAAIAVEISRREFSALVGAALEPRVAIRLKTSGKTVSKTVHRGSRIAPPPRADEPVASRLRRER